MGQTKDRLGLLQDPVWSVEGAVLSLRKLRREVGEGGLEAGTRVKRSVDASCQTLPSMRLYLARGELLWFLV